MTEEKETILEKERRIMTRGTVLAELAQRGVLIDKLRETSDLPVQRLVRAFDRVASDLTKMMLVSMVLTTIAKYIGDGRLTIGDTIFEKDEVAYAASRVMTYAVFKYADLEPPKKAVP